MNVNHNNHNDDDADLDDLLQVNHHAAGMQQQQHHLEMTPLNLDHLTRGPWNVTGEMMKDGSFSSSSFPMTNSNNNSSTCCDTLQDVLFFWANAHPKVCACTIVTLLATLLSLLATSIRNPTMEFGNIDDSTSDLYALVHEHFNTQSPLELQQGRIDHWCLAGDDNSCQCEDPLVPTARGEFRTWTKAHFANLDMLQELKQTYTGGGGGNGNEDDGSGSNSMIPCALVGESLVEEMNGRWMGQERGAQLTTMKRMFQQKFASSTSTNSTSGGGGGGDGDSVNTNAVALGIAGDTSPNVLWRLLHGEMPTWFSPPIWWISLGMNDLGRMQCSEQVVVIGILRVVEEILQQKPNAHVVINSMLPMADLRGGVYPQVQDYQDAFVNDKASRYVKKPSPVTTATTNAEENDTNGGRARARRLGGRTRRKEARSLRRHKNKQDPKYPLLDPSKTKMKKYQLFQKNRLPLWTSIYAINRELRNFCATQERVSFFDATSIFADKVEGGKYYMLRSDMISIRGHPTVAGYSAWEDAMVKEIQSILSSESKTTATAVTKGEDAASKQQQGEGKYYTVDNMNKYTMSGSTSDDGLVDVDSTSDVEKPKSSSRSSASSSSSSSE